MIYEQQKIMFLQKRTYPIALCKMEIGNVLPAAFFKVSLKLNLQHATSARNYQLKEETLSIQSIPVVAKIVR